MFFKKKIKSKISIIVLLLFLTNGITYLLSQSFFCKEATAYDPDLFTNNIKKNQAKVNRDNTSSFIKQPFFFSTTPSSNIEPKILENPLVCLLFISNYQIEGEYTSLQGTLKDFKKLKKLYTEKYRYEVFTNCDEEQPKSHQMNKKQLLDFIQKQLPLYLTTHGQQHDGIIFIYSGHGDTNTLVCSDGKEVSLEKIYDALGPKNLPNMAGKPKIYLFSKCRGEDWPKATQVGKKLYHRDEDSLKIYATTEGAKIKDEIIPSKKGSYLIEEWINYLERDQTAVERDLLSHFSLMGDKVKNNSNHLELPQMITTMYCDIYCKPNKEGSKKEELKIY